MPTSLRVSIAFLKFMEETFENRSIEKHLKELSFTKDGVRLIWENGEDYGMLTVMTEGEIHIYYTSKDDQFEMVGDRNAALMKDRLDKLLTLMC